MSTWTVFSNHGHVLLFLARFPEARLRDVADKVGITERAVQKIVKDLQDSQYISVHKHGRRNRYRINNRKPLRHELEAHKTVASLIKLIDKESKKKTTAKAAKKLPPLAAAGHEPGAQDFDDTIAYEQPDFEPDSELVPVSAYDPFEETGADFDTAAGTDAEPEETDSPVSVTPVPEQLPEPKTRQPATVKARDADAKPGAKKTAKKTKKDQPPDEQQGSLF